MPDPIKPLDLHSLERGGALVKHATRPMVRVILHDPSDLAPRSIAERRQFLEDEFNKLRRSRTLKQIEINLDELSVAGQCVSAVMPVDAWAVLVRRLRRRGLRVMPRIRFKAV